jgi:general secretion pathway protein N
VKARRWLLPAAAVLLALAAALYVLPARWLLLAMPANTPVSVVDASGTIWSGQARLAIGPAGMRRTLPDAIAWQWHWVEGIGPAARVEHPWLAAPVEIAPRLGGARMGQGKLTMPAGALAAMGAPLNTLEPGGELSLTWPALDLGDVAPKGPLLQLTWSHASSTRVRVQPLGDYQAALTSDGAGGMSLHVQTLRGPLRVEGQGQEHGGRWRFDGQAGPAPDTDEATQDALEPLLSVLGRYRNGVSQLRFP